MLQAYICYLLTYWDFNLCVSNLMDFEILFFTQMLLSHSFSDHAFKLVITLFFVPLLCIVCVHLFCFYYLLLLEDQDSTHK